MTATLAAATAPLADPTAEAIAQRVAGILASPPVTDLILTRDEAKAYVKCESEGAFSDWCKRHRVHARERGRWSRIALDRALELEALAGRRSSPRQRRAA